MALNNCFNSSTCTSMTEHLGGIGSPAEGLSLVPEAFVIGPEYAIVSRWGIFVRDEAYETEIWRTIVGGKIIYAANP